MADHQFFESEFDEENRVAIIRASGIVDTANIIRCSAGGLELMEKHKSVLLLIDIRKCTRIQSMARGAADLGDIRKTTGLQYHHRIAMVYDPEIYPEERAFFMENVISNRLNPKLKMFQSEEKAIVWLKAQLET